MKPYTIKDREGITIGYVYFYTDYEIKLYKNKKQFVQNLIKNLRRNRVGYGGFYRKRDLEKTLRKFIFFRDSGKEKEFTPLAKPKIQRLKFVQIIKKALLKCHNLLSIKRPLRIFIFPCLSEFVKKQMEGVSGFVPRQDVFYIFFHPKATHFEKRLNYTVAHEFYHAISYKYCKKWHKSILGSLISEGLANNFRIQAVDGELTPGLIALSPKQYLKIWPRVKKILNSKNHKIWRELFFEDKKYPLWTGYTLGYQIVKNFLEKHRKIKWPEIIKLKPEVILKESDWD